MLEKISIKGFKSFENEFVFDLSQIKSYEFNSDCIRNSIVNKAIVYGPNSCGKSNLGLAIFDVVSHLTDKEKTPSLYSDYLYANDPSIMAEFKLHFKIFGAKVLYHYGKKSQDQIIFESLSINEKVVVSLDKRNSQQADIKLVGAETLDTNFKETNLSVVKYVLRNAKLALNAENDVFIAFTTFVDKMLYFRSLDQNCYLGYEVGNRSVLDDILGRGNLSDFETFLNKACIKVKLEVEEINGKHRLMASFGERKIEFWKNASTGTRSLSLFYFWLQRLKREQDISLLFIDEFDAFYHPNLSRLVVEELKGNPSQTILTTHNTSIMTNDLLRPDCYFVMNYSEVYPLYQSTDKELRKAHNIEKMYKAGVFTQ